MVFGFICWNIVGLMVGFLFGKCVEHTGLDPRHGLIAASGGAVIGGMLHGRLSAAGVDVFDRHSLLAAAVGALLLRLAWQRFGGHRNGA